MRRIRIGSLCSGYGGLERGVGDIFPSSRVLYFADNDKAVSKVLAYRYPDIPNYGDIFAIRGDSIPETDILIAGFPCQPFSSLGFKRGADDERNIFGEIARIVSEMDTRPGMLVFENVSGLRTISDGRVFRGIIETLATLGYVGRYGLFRASETGAPHPRSRIFITAFAADSPGIYRRIQDAGKNAIPAHLQAREISSYRAVSNSATSLWAPFGNAVHRWESITGRTAPFPVLPFYGGAPRGSARFVEWMMGLPDGWVTDVPGLSWDEKIHILGNGVVPQQASYAIRCLVSHE